MLAGRELQLAAGHAAVAAALEGHGGLLLIAGEAGIGKSSLAQAMADRAAATGATVRVGACWDSEGLPPFTPWLDAFRRPGGDACEAVADRLASGPEDTTDAASAGRARARLFADVVDALHDVSQRRPQIVLLEDVHWADSPSLELLTAVARHLRSMPVLAIVTYRDDEMPRPSPLGSLGGTAERLSLEGVDADAVAEIVAAVTGRPRDHEAAVALHDRTGGNPLFVTELARLLGAGGEALPAGVKDVLERRLARVTSDCHDVLGAASVLGHEFDQSALEALHGTDVAAALDEARAARLVEPSAGSIGRWRFVHALVQATRYAALSTAEREARHRDAVGVLRGRPGATAALLAHHARRGRFDADDVTPAELLVAAGHEALAGLAWAGAVSSFEQALASAPDGATGSAARAEAWLGIGAARVRQDRADAREAFDAAARLARDLRRPDLLARAALGFSVGLGAFEVRMQDEAQIALLEEAAEALSGDDPLVPLVLARLSVALAFVGSDERRQTLATRAVELARAADQPVVLGHALAALCDARSGPEHRSERLAAAQEITTLGMRHGDVPLELLGRRHRVVALFEGMQLLEIDSEIVLYERAAASLRDPLYTWYPYLWRAVRAFGRGEIDAARRSVDDATAIGAGGGSVNSVMLGRVFELSTGIECRDREAADAAMEQMLLLMPSALSEYYALSYAWLEARFGELARSRSHLSLLAPSSLEALPRDSEWVPYLVQMEVAAALTGDHERLARCHGELLPLAGTGAVEGIGAYLHGPVDRYLAIGAAASRDAVATRRHVADAIRLVSDGGELLQALTTLDGAWALSQLSNPEDAEQAGTLARQARTVFDRVGLTALAREAAALEDGAGSAAPASAPEAAPKPTHGTLVRQGDAWAVSWEGTTVHVKHAKGVADLAVLLERPGREVHVRELEGSAAPRRSSHQPVLDETAVRQYRQRLADLEEDLDEADRHGDTERAARLAVERDALVEQLTSAFGLARQGRRLGSDPDERLRKAVSARIKASIDRLDGLDPSLGRHLRSSVHTGFWCAYAPERPVTWSVRR